MEFLEYDIEGLSSKRGLHAPDRSTFFPTFNYEPTYEEIVQSTELEDVVYNY